MSPPVNHFEITASDRLRLAIYRRKGTSVSSGNPGGTPSRSGLPATHKPPRPTLFTPAKASAPAADARPVLAVASGCIPAAAPFYQVPSLNNAAQPSLFAAPRTTALSSRDTRTARIITPAKTTGGAKPKKPVQGENARAIKSLKNLKFPSVEHMLLCVPSGYMDCRNPLSVIPEDANGYKGLFSLKKTGVVEALDANKRVVNPGAYDCIFQAPYKGYWEHIRQLHVNLVNEAGQSVWITYFNPWQAKNSDPLAAVIVGGTLRRFGSRIYLTETIEPPMSAWGRVWVRYVCPGAPSETDVRTLVSQALEMPDAAQTCSHALVTKTLLSEANLLAIAQAANGSKYTSLVGFFGSLHKPESPEEGVLAALDARAMAVAGVCSAANAANRRHPHAKAALNLSGATVDELVASQAEVLTVEQRQAIAGLVTALRSPKPLNGLLSGDVGTGKTLCFLIPAVAVQRAGGHVAIIAPTEILANQIYANLVRRFPSARAERVVAGGKILDPEAILVGTSGLASVARKAGYTPNFLVIDEQHKLATKDRNSMASAWTHQLEASATPIPRSLAATLFSGIEVFTLTTSPVKREIQSAVLDESERTTVANYMRDALALDQYRVAIIYPRVTKVSQVQIQDVQGGQPREDSQGGGVGAFSPADRVMISTVCDAADALEKRFPGKVGMLHGKMNSAALTQCLDDFRSGSKPLVVASTIMETGIDIPDIRLMIVKGAENFGTAQLHQLRGRLARNGGKAQFVMMVDDIASLLPETLQRLETVAKVIDGFCLAQADMVSRGFGDLAGDNQSGNVSSAFRLLRLSFSDFDSQNESALKPV